LLWNLKLFGVLIGDDRNPANSGFVEHLQATVLNKWGGPASTPIHTQRWPDPWNRWPDVRGMPGQIAWNTQAML
jgi:hypothetical protein